MSKKKKVVVQTKPSNQAVPPEYTVGTWSGRKHYQCKLCVFDVLEDEMAMLRHLVQAHNSEAALVRLVDRETSEPTATAARPEGDAGDGAEVLEVELVETGSHVDADGNVRKTYTIKEDQ